MDHQRFDDWTRALATSRSRRAVLKGAAAGLLGALGLRSPSAAQVTQAQCGNTACKNNPGKCNDGCVCCVYGNGNSRCRPPGACSPGVETCPPGEVPDPIRGCVPNAPTPECTTPGQCLPPADPCQVATCIAGVCGTAPVPCMSGQVCCGGPCVDLNADPAHCGACGAVCTAPATCTGGACTCVPLTCDSPDAACGTPDGCGGVLTCQTCGTGECVAGVCKEGPGGSCDENADCASGSCRDRTCCLTECTGVCEGCGPTGACTPRSGFNPACAGEGMCGGSCDGVNGATCTYPGPDTACGDSTCQDGVQSVFTCDGSGSCFTALTPCGLFACNPTGTACLTACATDDDCLGAAHCDLTGGPGVCQADLVVGDPCETNDQCPDGRCIHGVCCDAPCDGPCDRCDLTGIGQPGTCGPVLDDTPCDGQPGTCCAGACLDLTADPNNCGHCLLVCGEDYVCEEGTCFGGPGARCLAHEECQSSHCALPEGICCETACDSPCDTCGTDGICGRAADGAACDACVYEATCNQGTCWSFSCENNSHCCGRGLCNMHLGICSCPQEYSGTDCCAPVGPCDPGYESDNCQPPIAEGCVNGGLYCSGRGACGQSGDCVCLPGYIGDACNMCTPEAVAPPPSGAIGEACGADFQCASGQCRDGVCCDSFCRGRCRRCDRPGLLGVCGPAADGIACKFVDGTCCGGGTCLDGTFCPGEGGPGTTCSSGRDCASRQCVDGVCCDRACDGPCEVCGPDGICTTAPAGTACDVCAYEAICDPRLGDLNGGCSSFDCANNNHCSGHGLCNMLSGTCDCHPEYSGTDCIAPVGPCDEGEIPDGCTPRVPPPECENGGSYCHGRGACSESGPCVCLPGFSGDACQDCDPASVGPPPALDPGEPCAADFQCTTNYCRDGVCCDRSCLGRCERCDRANQIGTCGPVADGSACEGGGDGACCGGRCFFGTCQANGAVCTTNDECSSRHCVAGICCDTACEGGCGLCDATTNGLCTPLNGTDCQPANQCATGVCDVGVCTPETTKPDGAACHDAPPCESAGACQAGACVSPPGSRCCFDDFMCSDSPCLTGVCDTEARLCVMHTDDAACAHPDVCVRGATCQSGDCAGGTRTDCLPCTACNPNRDQLALCLPDPTQDGTACCNGAGTCQAGACDSPPGTIC